MKDLGFIVCDDGVTQPLHYLKEGSKYYFGVGEILCFGCSREPEIIKGYEFEDIKPLYSTRRYLGSDKCGQLLIGVKKVGCWGLWRYTEYETSENLTWQRPVESSRLLGRVLEIVPDISTPTLKEALDEYRSKYL